MLEMRYMLLGEYRNCSIDYFRIIADHFREVTKMVRALIELE